MSFAQQSGLRLLLRDESRQHFSAAIDPSAQFSRGGSSVALVDPSTRRRRLKLPRAEVEREVYKDNLLAVR